MASQWARHGERSDANLAGGRRYTRGPQTRRYREVRVTVERPLTHAPGADAPAFSVSSELERDAFPENGGGACPKTDGPNSSVESG